MLVIFGEQKATNPDDFCFVGKKREVLRISSIRKCSKNLTLPQTRMLKKFAGVDGSGAEGQACTDKHLYL